MSRALVDFVPRPVRLKTGPYLGIDVLAWLGFVRKFGSWVESVDMGVLRGVIWGQLEWD